MIHNRGFATSIALSSIAVVALLSAPHACAAQVIRLSDANRQALIESTIALVQANYIDLDRAKTVAKELRSEARSGAYRGDVDLDAFLEHLNGDMQRAASDKHLRVGCSPKVVAQLRKDAADGGEVDSGYLRMLEEKNFGLRRVESLEGNIGYFKVDGFVEPRFGRETLVGAMNFLRHSSAIVLDFTDNGGGSAEAADLLVSYFLPEGTRVGERWNRATNTTTPSIVTRAPDVKAMLDTPVVVLVGGRTASAAEAVAYTLQQAKRATVVGTRTKGMAHSGEIFAMDDSFFVMVPTHIQKNAVTGTDWEGSGVVPDIAASPETTYPRGVATALDLAAERRADPKEKYRLGFLARAYAAEAAPESPPPGFLDACVGDYADGQKIAMRDGVLHYRKGGTDRALHYMGDRTFAVEGRTDYRLQFEVVEGKALRCKVLWFDDTSDVYRRSN